MVEEESDDSSEYSDDEDELGNKVSISGYIPQNIKCGDVVISKTN